MYIISVIKGFQYKLDINCFLYIPYIKHYKKNDFYYIKKNLIYKNKNKLKIGYPYLKKFVVISKIICHLKGNKKIIFKKKRRKGYKKKIGYRTKFTKIKILFIKNNGA